MFNHLKNGNINIKIDVNQKDVLKTNLEFWSHDLKSGLLTIKYTNLGEPVALVCDSAVRLIMRFTEKGETKHRIETMTVTDKINGIATLEIPDEILGYEGIVECGTYIDFKNGQTLDAGYFTFRMKKSMIDGEFKALDTIYIKEFSEAVEKIKLIAEEYESKYATAIADDQERFNDLINSWQEIGNVNELATKKEVRLIDKKIDDISIGGTNLIIDSTFDQGFKHYPIAHKGYSIDNTKKLMGQNTLRFQWENGTPTYPSVMTDFIEVRESGKIGREVTLSVYVFIPTTAELSNAPYIEVAGYENTSQTVNDIINNGRLDVPLTLAKGVWHRLNVKARIPESNKNGQVNFVRVLLRHRADKSPTIKDQFWYGLHQLEFGNQLSDWGRSVSDTPTIFQLNSLSKDVESINRLIKKSDFPRFIMHRGYHLNTNMYQENSIRSFEAAKGNYGVETDIRVTKDGKFVCIHDETVNRTTSGTGLVSDLTLAKILTFNLKTPFPTEVGAENLQKVPTLEQYLEINRKNNTVAFIEIKTFNNVMDYDNFIEIIRGQSMINICYVISFDLDALK